MQKYALCRAQRQLVGFGPLALGLSLVVAGLSCSQEKNPYAERLIAESDATGTQATESKLDAKTKNPPGALLNEMRNALKVICAEPSLAEKNKVGMSFVCVNGKATKAINTAIVNAYDGTGEPTIYKMRSTEDKEAQTSELIFISAIEVDKPISFIIENLDKLDGGNLSVKPSPTIDVKSNLTVVATIPPTGPNELRKTEMLFELSATVSSLQQPPRKSRLISETFSINAEKTILARLVSLKPGAAENQAKDVNDSVFFYVAEGNKTKMFSVLRTVQANLGFHSTVITIGQAISKTIAADTQRSLSK